ncbi:MAG: SBBP repeat-containing protein, partial [Rhodothermia bacterium]
PEGVVTMIIDASGDGAGHTLRFTAGIAVDGFGNVYVTGLLSHNAFMIAPSGIITEIIDASGDGKGNLLEKPPSIAVGGLNEVYVVGSSSHNVFKIALFVFSDGFESGDTSAWSGSLP